MLLSHHAADILVAKPRTIRGSNPVTLVGEMSRLLSLILYCIYVVYAFGNARPDQAIKVAVGMLLPLVCIWFPQEAGDYVPDVGRITAPSPASFVWFFGWVVLLVPLLFVGVASFYGAWP